jgi:hypothetical protein
VVLFQVLLQSISTSFKSSSSRFSKILHNSKFGWTLSRCPFFDSLRTLSESYLKHLKTRGRNTRQPRLENIISKQVSAWTLKLVVKEKLSNIGLVLQNFQRI